MVVVIALSTSCLLVKLLCSKITAQVSSAQRKARDDGALHTTPTEILYDADKITQVSTTLWCYNIRRWVIFPPYRIVEF